MHMEEIRRVSLLTRKGLSLNVKGKMYSACVRNGMVYKSAERSANDGGRLSQSIMPT